MTKAAQLAAPPSSAAVGLAKLGLPVAIGVGAWIGGGTGIAWGLSICFTLVVITYIANRNGDRLAQDAWAHTFRCSRCGALFDARH